MLCSSYDPMCMVGSQGRHCPDAMRRRQGQAVHCMARRRILGYSYCLPLGPESGFIPPTTAASWMLRVSYLYIEANRPRASVKGKRRRTRRRRVVDARVSSASQVYD